MIELAVGAGIAALLVYGWVLNRRSQRDWYRDE